MNRLQWYFHRLRKMRLAELPHRLRQSLKKKYDRQFLPSPPLGNKANWQINIRHTQIRTENEGSFPFRDQLIESAENALAHRFSFFGLANDFGHPVDWHLDPKTGNSWPLEFWNDIEHRDGHKIGGIKFAWELNRLHHLPILALAFQMTGDEKFETEVFDTIQSWMDDNPFHIGINWISGIELGIRVVNLIYALRYLEPESLTAERRELVCRFISMHGWRLHRYPSKYSSCNNHAIAEALGAFMAGLCLPELPGAHKWKRFGKSVLESEITRQIYPDGSSFEHSTDYLQFVLDHFLVYYLLCKDHGEPCGDEISDRLISGLKFINAISDEKPNVPTIGDSDDGYLLKLNLSGQSNFASLLNSGAILFNRPDWILPSAAFDLKTWCLLGNESADTWEALKTSESSRETASRYFPDAGLAVIRIDTPPNTIIVGNSGPLGQPPLAGHGHADALSFTLTIQNVEILVDPGTYLYQSGGKWRNYFRSTSAHNTIMIDKQDQSPIIADFMFGKPYNVTQVTFEQKDGGVVWSAIHDGYTRLSDPVLHKRVVSYENDRHMVIEDTVTCTREHLVESFFHFHPRCSVSLTGRRAQVRCGSVRVEFELDPAWDSYELIRGRNDPVLGWYSPGFNRIEETFTLVTIKRLSASICFRTQILLNHLSARD